MSEHSRALRKYDDVGAPVNNARVLELGFDKGVQVIRKADEVVAVIEEILPDRVILKLVSDGSLVTSSSAAFINGKWKKHSEKTQPTELEQWWASSPSASPEFLAATIKGRVLLAMLQQWEGFKHEKSLQVFSKPKDVKSLRAFPVGALTVPITTSRVDIRPSAQAGLQVAIMIGSMKGAGPDMAVYILPTVSFPKDTNIGFVSPAWVMKASCDKDECNVELANPSKNWNKQKLEKLTATIHLPFLKNFRKIEAEDSLILYRPDLAKVDDIEKLQPVTPAPKKARTS